jgi:hypothetical protein
LLEASTLTTLLNKYRCVELVSAEDVSEDKAVIAIAYDNE